MKTWIIAGIAATLLSGCYEKDRIATLEKENQQLKARLAVLEDEYPTGIDLLALQAAGRKNLGFDLPDIEAPGYKTSIATLGGIIDIENQAQSVTNSATFDVSGKVLEPLRRLQDMWPANTSKTGKTMSNMDRCRNLPGLYLTITQLSSIADKDTVRAAAHITREAQNDCVLTLMNLVVKDQHKKPADPIK